jgi:hypothetical protein
VASPRHMLARLTIALALASPALLLTASTAGAHGRAVAVARAPVKVNPYNNGIKFYGHYFIRNAIQHYRVRIVVCLQVRTDSGRWAHVPGACAWDTDRRDWWVNAGGRGPCLLGRHTYRTRVTGGARTRSGEWKHVRRDVSRTRTITC